MWVILLGCDIGDHMFETVDRKMVVMNDDDLADDCRDGVTNRSVQLWVAGNSSWRYAVDAVALC